MYCRNLPFGGRARRNKMAHLLMKKMRGVATTTYQRKTLEKPKRRMSANFENKGSGVVYAHGRYQHPTRSSKWMVAFDRVCKNVTSKLSIFPFYIFYLFFLFIFIFIFILSIRVLPLLLRILRCDEEFRPTQFFKSESLGVTLVLCFLKD